MKIDEHALPVTDAAVDTADAVETTFEAPPPAPPPAPRKRSGKSKPDNDNRPPDFADDDIALRFADRHAHDLRFVAEHGKWFRFDGKRWQSDKTRNAYDLVRRTCRETAEDCREPRVVTAIKSGKTVATVERMAQADQRIAATLDQFDADPWLLNTPGGVVDLRTGRIRAHRADDYMTKITAAAPRGDCPLFLAFLDRIMAADKELIAYIRRVLGYALTGVTTEQALFFGHGTGGNGKGVLISTIAGLMGDYHKTATMETFTASRNPRHLTEVARLVGARFVTASETEEGKHWDEARVKLLTGGDEVSANFMRQDQFDFTPLLKLFVLGNYQPTLKTVDEAIRRRLQMIPFAVTIPPDERDLQLANKLKVEWPGILRWAIEGCLEWQDQGLRPPRAVKATTAEYMETQDTFSAWLAERCERKQDAWSGSTALFQSWSSWAKDAGEEIGSLMRLSGKLKNHAFEPKPTNTGNGFLGLRIRPRN